MVGLVTDSLDCDELTDADELKLPSIPVPAAADCAVPSINDLDFCSPLFDSLPDFETLKDYWICHSPIEERSLLEIEQVMDAETSPVVANGDVVKGEGQSSSLGGVKVEGSEENQNEGLEEVKSEEKITIEVSGSLSPTIEANLRKVSLDGPVDVSAAKDSEMEEKCDEAENDDSSESESESDSSKDSSSEATSSSDDEEEEDGVVKRKAELQLEEGEIMEEDVEQMVAWSDDEDEVVKGPIRSKNEITVS